MNVVCPACERLVPLTVFRLDAGELYVTCSRCGVESAAGGAPPPSPSTPPGVSGEPVDPFAVPADRCPKCIAVRPANASACPSCGLSFEGATADAYAPSSELAGQWRELLGRWSDLQAHEKLVSAASLQGDLAPLGRLYRLRLALFPGDGAARQGRDAVLARASAPSAFPPPVEESKRTETWKVVALGVVVVVLLVVAFRLIRLFFALRA
ncbi:MAG TPA: hypothetical protein VH208_12945 [Myxococcaceae bacterium]|nr:hypothetical protein [Myxococcaceae bacterium]